MKKRYGSCAENAWRRVSIKGRSSKKLSLEYIAQYELLPCDFVSKSTEAGTASDYIHFFNKLLKDDPSRPLFLYYRVSKIQQEREGNAINILKEFKAQIEKLGGNVIDQKSEQAKASDLSDRVALCQLAEQAKAIDGAIVTPCLNRFLRQKHYNPQNPENDFPTIKQYEELQEVTMGVPLATLLHPDASPKEATSYVTKIGQKTKGRKGGRPRKEVIDNEPNFRKRRRRAFESIVKKLIRLGKSNQEIADEVNKDSRFPSLTRQTIFDWRHKMSL